MLTAREIQDWKNTLSGFLDDDEMVGMLMKSDWDQPLQIFLEQVGMGLFRVT